ncbi:MAG: UDP-N-acetyl-D-mannosamine dehydrogenase, partial [Helicobacteraceae bacterium]|nr:UDP-N-acetyl-D-mannosamine dehydrogenase [Helicobacteraceae bacterium]
RDVSIAFANELSMICDKLDINVWELITLANRHPRVNILQPGPGVGGHCIAVDPWFIVSKTPEQAQLIHTARKVNDSKPDWVVNKVKQAIGEYLVANPSKTAKDISIACFGLVFKPDIDDLRESPALNITQLISKFHPGRLLAVEPNIDELPDSLIDAVELINIDEALSTANIILMLVDHKEFIGLKFDNDKTAIDTKGILLPQSTKPIHN